MSDALLQEINDGVLLVTFNNAQKKNAFNTAAWLELADLLNAAKENDQVRCVVMTGAGNDFSSGQDLSEMPVKDASGRLPYRYTEKAFLEFDKPLLMCAKGIAIGGGGTILFHADIVYVGESLRFRLPFAGLGLPPEFGSSYLLQANIGAQRAAEILYSADWLNADQVLEAGMAARKFSDDELLEKTLEKARAIAQLAPNALRESKRCLKLAHQQSMEAAYRIEGEAMDRLVGGPEHTEAITAFIEKRAPKWG